MTTDEISSLAAQGAEMPSGLDSAQQRFFQSLRLLYAQHRIGVVSPAQGAKEKAQITEQFKADCLAQRIYKQHLEIYNRTGTLLMDAGKSDCPRCQTFAKLLDGRITL